MDTEIVSKLDQSYALYLHAQYEVARDEGTLVVIVREATLNPASKKLELGHAGLEEVFGLGQSIDVLKGNLEFTLTFESTIAYQVIDESAAIGEPNEDYSKKLRITEQSSYLNYFKATQSVEPYEFLSGRPIISYGLACANHWVEVLSSYPPTIKQGIVKNG